MTVIFLFLLLFIVGCKGNTSSNNQATRYADGLHDDVRGAEKAAQTATQKVNEFNQTTSQPE